MLIERDDIGGVFLIKPVWPPIGVFPKQIVFYSIDTDDMAMEWVRRVHQTSDYHELLTIVNSTGIYGKRGEHFMVLDCFDMPGVPDGLDYTMLLKILYMGQIHYLQNYVGTCVERVEAAVL